jgi:hypothetical protein
MADPQATEVASEGANPQSPAVVDGKAAGVPLGKKAFDRGDLSPGRVLPVMQASDWKVLEKKYGESGAEDYVEAQFEAAEQEFNRLVVNAIGERPYSKGDYDKSEATRVYFSVLARLEQTVKSMAHDEKSIKFQYPTAEYQLTRYKGKYAWGATFKYTGKNAFNATRKEALNVYIANAQVVGMEEGTKSVTQQDIERELAKTAAEKKGTAKKKKQ